jgi:hypothetical protein
VDTRHEALATRHCAFASWLCDLCALCGSYSHPMGRGLLLPHGWRHCLLLTAHCLLSNAEAKEHYDD